MIARIRIRSPRRAMSMAEVLVALFLLALGTIAILTMFPLGMYQMGQALKDDRTSQAANQADAFMRMYWRMNVVENIYAEYPQAAGYQGYEPAIRAFDHPDWYADFQYLPISTVPPAAYSDHRNLPNLPAPVSPPPVAYVTTPNPRRGTAGLPDLRNQPTHSYPVFVDPMGYETNWNILNANAFDLKYWVGGQAYARRSLNAFLPIPSPPWAAAAARNPLMNAQRSCSMLDGYGYDEGGIPTSGGAFAGFERDLRYNWMWILQRPDNSDRNTANMTVVVFDKRAYQFAPQGAEQVFVSGPMPAQPAQQIPMIPGTTVIQVPKTQGIPPVQKGGWIMDATHVPGVMRHAIFYRVVSVTDNPNNVWNLPAATVVPTTDIEVQSPVRRMDGSLTNYSGSLMYFMGVSEVFERPNLRSNSY